MLLHWEKTNKSVWTYRQIISSLEDVIWVEDPLIVCPQMRANSFAWRKAHLYRYLSPAPLLADSIEAPLFIHQLKNKGIIYSAGVLKKPFIWILKYTRKYFPRLIAYLIQLIKI